MGTTTETPLLTFEEFERLPDQPGKRELLEGELVELPPAELKHARIAHRIYKALNDAVDAGHSRGEATELGEVLMEAGYHFDARSWVQPDVSISHAAQREGKYFRDAPAIAIEVISPNSRAVDIDTKTSLYFQFGAREVWLVYPKTRRIVVHAGSGSNIRVEHETLTTPLLPGLSLSVSEILGG